MLYFCTFWMGAGCSTERAHCGVKIPSWEHGAPARFIFPRRLVIFLKLLLLPQVLRPLYLGSVDLPNCDNSPDIPIDVSVAK